EMAGHALAGEHVCSKRSSPAWGEPSSVQCVARAQVRRLLPIRAVLPLDCLAGGDPQRARGYVAADLREGAASAAVEPVDRMALDVGAEHGDGECSRAAIGARLGPRDCAIAEEDDLVDLTVTTRRGIKLVVDRAAWDRHDREPRTNDIH